MIASILLAIAVLFPSPLRDAVWLERVTPIYADFSVHNSCDDTPWWDGPVIAVYYTGGVDWYQFEDAYIIERDEWCHYRLTFAYANKPIDQLCLASPDVPVAGIWLQGEHCWIPPKTSLWMPKIGG